MQPTPSAASSHPDPIPTSCISAHWEHWEPPVRARGGWKEFSYEKRQISPNSCVSPPRECGISQNRAHLEPSTMLVDPILCRFTFVRVF